MEYYIRNLQKTICGHLEDIESLSSSQHGAKFHYDETVRDPASGMSGGGIVSVLQEGAVYEKAGINISVIYGKMPTERIANMRADHKELQTHLSSLASSSTSSSPPPFFPFAVAGLSLVLHPRNPHIPTCHANYRLFEVDLGTKRVWWMGGGSDLTPAYVNDGDAKHFHSLLKQACDMHDPMVPRSSTSSSSSSSSSTTLSLPPLFHGFTRSPSIPSDYTGVIYPKFKHWCDNYFRIPHRNNESRGVGKFQQI